MNLVDIGNNLNKFEKLRSDLEKIKRDAQKEMKFKPLEKWMIKELGVRKLPNKRGSHVFYEHDALKPINRTGHFQVALKNNRILYRDNFLEFTYKRLKEIIDGMELEERSGS